MNKYLGALFIALSLLSTIESQARRKSCGSSKAYVKKTPCADFGKPSATTGKIKTKRTEGHWKKTGKSRNTTYVNSYSRS